MTTKPKEAIERMRQYMKGSLWPDIPQASLTAILAYLDSLPDDAHVCEWPKELTRDRLEHFARCIENWQEKIADALRALAAIAPKAPKKRMVNLWRCVPSNELHDWPLDRLPNWPEKWRKVAGPVEIDE